MSALNSLVGCSQVPRVGYLDVIITNKSTRMCRILEIWLSNCRWSVVLPAGGVLLLAKRCDDCGSSPNEQCRPSSRSFDFILYFKTTQFLLRYFHVLVVYVFQTLTTWRVQNGAQCPFTPLLYRWLCCENGGSPPTSQP